MGQYEELSEIAGFLETISKVHQMTTRLDVDFVTRHADEFMRCVNKSHNYSEIHHFEYAELRDRYVLVLKRIQTAKEIIGEPKLF